MARPSKYREEYCIQAQKLCLLGAIDKQLADFFGVSEPTLNKWKKDFPEFLKSLKKGKGIADNKVVRALYERATGYSHPDTHISNYQGDITVTPIVKHYPPDTGACIFWLKNRDKENWRDKPDEGGAGVEEFAELMRLAAKRM
ncbi:MAG: hypothetical protein KAS32_20235 [Candidatus Peribacteraceae bacterium]|nr:hypothetical protein [Candidatus Peribacteraceae bacterium]